MAGGLGGGAGREAAGHNPPRPAEVVRLVARLGGHVGGPGRGAGAQTMWVGLQRMFDLARAWESFGPGAKAGGP